MTNKAQLGREIAYAGGWEEYHQKRARDPQVLGDGDMVLYEYWKAERLALLEEYSEAL